MNREFIAKYWYADVYEQFENQTDDVDFLLKVLSKQWHGAPLNILEAACGGGRISIPLARAGHTVTGFDADEYMLMRCYRRMRGMENIRVYKEDGATGRWGSGYDLVIMGANLLINIEAAMEYEQAQEVFIRKAASALRPGGHLYLDFDLHYDPASVFGRSHVGQERVSFEGTDDMGTYGRIVGYGSGFDPVTRICAYAFHWEITANNGERFILPKRWYKHIPTQAQVYRWLADAGLTIERAYKNFSDEQLCEPIDEGTWRATIWARL